MSEERFDRIDQKLTEIDQRFTAVDQNFTELQAGVTDLGRQMRVLYEDVRSDIAALRPEGPSRAEVKRWDDELRESLGQRIDPLEAAVRDHSAEIERLNKARRG